MEGIKDILVINPGSTSTKIAVYTDSNKEVLLKTNIVHDEDKILEFPSIVSQKEYRSEMILEYLKSQDYDLANLSAVVGRGGMVKELEIGGYAVDDALIKRMEDPALPAHASTLGALIAYEIATPLGLPSFIYDAPLSCKISEVAKITGIAEIERYGACHVLNERAMAMQYADDIGANYKDLNLIVCHMGGGITVCAQKGGDIVDTVSYDDGPMSPERSGGVPLILFKGLCFDGKHSEAEMDRLISGKGGIYSYLGTKNCIEVEEKINEGNDYAALIYRAMAYQIGKSIAEMSVALEGKVDAVIITGGIAHSKMLTEMITNYVKHLGKVVIMPGEKEMEALANGAYRMLSGSEAARHYGR